MDEIVNSTENLGDIVEKNLSLSPLEDPAEERALVQTLSRYDERIVFLENEGRKLCAFSADNRWHIKKIPGELSGEELAEFLEYIIDFFELARNTLSAEVSYYSVDPLVYGGKYWLDNVCRRELGAYNKNDLPFSILAVDEVDGNLLRKILNTLRAGDRPGYFGDLLGVILPATEVEEAEKIRKRLKDDFYLDHIYVWQVERDFENLHELKTRVEKKI
ncbi:MAG: hypothetical protein ACQEP7_04095 [bacterium]